VLSLHKAAKKGSLEKVRAFLTNGEKIDVKDKSEMTHLYYAAVGGHKDICEYLISQGVDIEARDKNGRTPIFEACSSTRSEKQKGGVDINNWSRKPAKL